MKKNLVVRRMLDYLMGMSATATTARLEIGAVTNFGTVVAIDEHGTVFFTAPNGWVGKDALKFVQIR